MKFVLDQNELNFDESYLPMLISGKEGSGASYFSICVAADFYLKGRKLFFFTLKGKAKEAFLNITGKQSGDIIFAPSGDVEKAEELIPGAIRENRLIFIKNIENTLSKPILDLIKNYNFLILSGDFDPDGIPFKTKIKMDNYEGDFEKDRVRGKIKIID